MVEGALGDEEENNIVFSLLLSVKSTVSSDLWFGKLLFLVANLL